MIADTLKIPARLRTSATIGSRGCANSEGTILSPLFFAMEVADVFRLGERRSSELSICLNENCATYLVIGLLSFKNGAFENPVDSGSKSLT